MRHLDSKALLEEANESLERNLSVNDDLIPRGERLWCGETSLDLFGSLRLESLHHASGEVEVTVEEALVAEVLQPQDKLAELDVHEAAHSRGGRRQSWNDLPGRHLDGVAFGGLDVVVPGAEVGGDGEEVDVVVGVVVLLKVVRLGLLEFGDVEFGEEASNLIQSLLGHALLAVGLVFLGHDLSAGGGPLGLHQTDLLHSRLELSAAADVGNAPDVGEEVGGGVQVLHGARVG
mmetsp:Transcript_1318/g.2673  ORF Transcript_1318/g.2673 Transcript_1318/m.2673 type:complete len:233 (-) Transcript_1318:770-1468(-)